MQRAQQALSAEFAQEEGKILVVRYQRQEYAVERLICVHVIHSAVLVASPCDVDIVVERLDACVA